MDQPETDILKILEIQVMDFQKLCSEINNTLNKNDKPRQENNNLHR